MRIEIDLKPEELRAIINMLNGKPSGLSEEQTEELKKYLEHEY